MELSENMKKTQFFKSKKDVFLVFLKKNHSDVFYENTCELIEESLVGKFFFFDCHLVFFFGILKSFNHKTGEPKSSVRSALKTQSRNYARKCGFLHECNAEG